MSPGSSRTVPIRPALIYDANCALCEATKNFLARWDKYHSILFLHFQGNDAKILLPFLAGMDHLEAMYFLDKKGKNLEGDEGMPEISQVLSLWAALWFGFFISRAFRSWQTGCTPGLPETVISGSAIPEFPTEL